MPLRTSNVGLSTDNIIEGGRKRARGDQDGGAQNSPLLGATSTMTRAGSTPAPPMSDRESVTRLGFRILDYVINRPDEGDDSPLCIPFLALPLRSDYPDYYEQIKTPLSLEQIRRRLQARRYGSADEVRNAFETIWRNAKRYNVKGSDIYERARQLHTISRDAFVDLANGDTIVSLDGGPVESKPALFELSGKLAKTEKPNALARLDYDEVDDGPPTVSLRLKRSDDLTYEEDDETVTAQIQSSAGVKTEQEHDDGDTVMANAAVKSEKDAAVPHVKALAASPALASQTPDSEGEGEDAVDLSELPGYDVTTGLLNGKPIDKSMLTQNGKFDRRKRPGPRGKRLKSTLRHLIAEMRSAVARNGGLLCEYFQELPSKHDLPDYYQVVTKPISIREIEFKANHSQYVNPHAMVRDLRLMTANAKYYNEDNSPVWRAADEVDRYVNENIIAPLLADGFTLNPDDMRQSALPMEYAAASPIAAHAAAFRRAAMAGPDSMQSPEPSAGGLRADQAAAYGGAVPGPSAPPFRAPTQPIGAQAAIVPPPMRQSGSPSVLPWQGQDRSPVAGQQPGYPFPSEQQIPAGSPHQPGLANAMSPPAAQGRLPYPPTHHPTPAHASPFHRPQSGVPSVPFGTPLTPGSQQHQQQQPTDVARLPKRLTGDPPPDVYAVTTLALPDGKVWTRKPIISTFAVRGTSLGAGSMRSAIILANDVTRIHSLCLGQSFTGPASEVANGERTNFAVEFRLRELIQAAVNGARDEGADSHASGGGSRPWKVNVRYNGRHVPFNVIHDGQPAKKHEVAANKSLSHKESLAKLNEGVEVAQGAKCSVPLCLMAGTSAFDLTVMPPPPDPLLAAIARDEANPQNALARTLSQMPDKYRIFLHRS